MGLRNALIDPLPSKCRGTRFVGKLPPNQLSDYRKFTQISASVAELPTEIVRHIFIAGINDKEHGARFGAVCMRTASWVQSWIAPILYRAVDLWTESQAQSFLRTIESNHSRLPYSMRTLVHSLLIKTAAFSAYETQHEHSRQTEPGNFTPSGVTSNTVLKILAILSQAECTNFVELDIPMVILATKRHNYPPTISTPRTVTLTGVDGLVWGAYNWSALTRIRFTSYNPTFHETRWLIRLPNLTHCAFAFYHEPPLGIQIVEELTGIPRMQCVLVVVYPSSQRGPGRSTTFTMRKALQRLDEPKLVVWEDSPRLISAFGDEDVDRFWKQAECIAEEQRLKRQAALAIGC